MKSPPIALWICYRGDVFCGFQGQGPLHTVQGALRQALLRIGVISAPVGAGRTDKGVHARMQVVRVRKASLSPADLLARLTSHLSPGLGVCAAHAATRSFHPQWSSTGKEYRYRLRLGPSCPGWEQFSWDPQQHPRLLDRAVQPERLSELLALAKGTRDFIAFHEKSSSRRPRTLREAKLVETSPGRLEVRLEGDAFGRYQARYLVGSAIAAAAGAIAVEQYRAGLEHGTAFPGLRAPPHGLILWEITYPPNLDPFDRHERLGGGYNLLEEPPFQPW